MLKTLMEHERKAAEIIVRQPRVLLFDAMGAGKTVSVLAAIKQASDNTGGCSCIVCAPNTIIGQWANEISIWLGSDFNVVIALGDKIQREVKYEYFSSLNKSNVILLTNYSFLVRDEFFNKAKASFLVLDEGYLLRNKTTKAYKFLRHFIDRFDNVVMLSGNTSSFSDQQFYDLSNLMFPGLVQKDSKFLIQQALGEKYISRNLESVCGISKPEIIMKSLSLNQEQKSLLKELAVEENRAMKNSNYNPREFYRKRLDILNSPRILDKKYSKSPKEDLLSDILSEQSGKCVIYCTDIKFFKLLKTDLNELNINFVAVSGDMPVYLRHRNISLFNSDESIKCLLLSGVGKFGLNLQVANTLICMCIPKGNFDLVQVIGRLNRINQTEKVHCIIPWYQDTDESKLIKKLDISVIS